MSLLENKLLQLNIVFAEMYDYKFTPLTTADVADDGELLDVGLNGKEVADLARIYANVSSEGYPVYTPDPSLVNKYPSTKTNVLMLQGTTDPATPYEWAMHAITQYPGDNQQLVTIPMAVHGTVRAGSPVQPSLSPLSSSRGGEASMLRAPSKAPFVYVWG